MSIYISYVHGQVSSMFWILPKGTRAMGVLRVVPQAI
jgi:hypothetical protein